MDGREVGQPVYSLFTKKKAPILVMVIIRINKINKNA